MKVFVVTFHTGSNDIIANIFSSKIAAKMCGEIVSDSELSLAWKLSFLWWAI